ncbi:Gfo/Idh/MocA family oxidoreductase [Flavobacterium panacagri]|uniref:Gfo/Idh/MocA family oxidoreductase n=1 Tax=Flavobacterium panacagri TaxID=3034146 RepID=UPI0025A68513|nr:Gfo/Idh/MocA family oxidoreductase [Flavobacterium panacagri]
MKKNILLVGTGPMALDYAKVLTAQDFSFQVIGRGQESAEKFKTETDIQPFVGGLQKYLENHTLTDNTYIIIATGTEVLMNSLISVLEAGAERVLIEKPAAISIEELIENKEKLLPYSEKVFVAYNRRFYASVIEAKKMIEEDGGLQTIHFEFTEWSHVIEPLTKAPGVKENWFFANSTHVVDLAFHFAGKPQQWQTYSKAGTVKWHAKTNFTGAGITEKGVLFSYLSNWESAGRWAIELLTEKRRIYLKPMEGLSVQKKGTVTVIEHEFDNSADLQFKPGLKNQLKAFLDNDETKLLNIKEHISISKEVYSKIIS